MNAKSLIEAETPKQFIKRALGPNLAGWLAGHGYTRDTDERLGTMCVWTKTFNDPHGWHAYIDVTHWPASPGVVQVAIGIKNGGTFYKEKWERATGLSDKAAIAVIASIESTVAGHAPSLIDKSRRGYIAALFDVVLTRVRYGL